MAQPQQADPCRQAPTAWAGAIRAGDALSISVSREPELTKHVEVRPDGKISFSLVGELQAAGKTPRQLAQTLADALSRFIHKPIVVVRDADGREVRSEIHCRNRDTFLKPAT